MIDAVIILAAGQGTRMRSKRPKVLHHLAGQPLLYHVIQAARALDPQRMVVVVGHGADQVQSTFAGQPQIEWAIQDRQLGTGHAVQCALPALEGVDGDVLILNGDVPLIQSSALQTFLDAHRTDRRLVSVLSTTIDPPTGYGRIVRNEAGEFLRIVEEKDADNSTRVLTEINSGTYAVQLNFLRHALSTLSNNNAQGEYYLTDIISSALNQHPSPHPTGCYLHPDFFSLSGVNNRRHLAALERAFRDRLVERLMDEGVTFIDPESCWLDADVNIGPDTVIHPNVILGPEVTIGANCTVGAFCHISRSRIGDECEILPFCHLDGATLEGGNPVGPYARLRPLAELAPNAKVGNFCEVKKARIGHGSKVNHLTYIGDATIGRGVNVGAGTITCNYDGANKHQTIIGDGAFIGSDVQMVAPVNVGAGAVIGAGTTVTKNVPDDALALSRPKQVHIPNWRKRSTK
ncbi:MAG: bifunctional UDP-N-acetylglucosamine diphosphorylase/glucosamine-1-phosphate N-acetyltransferase GlmU [Magnetococcales bacterium]|nr:bifunctional UDP-N-acetylglucosamine diphosphorylase/glucosamine-1-phosphate N-acetyltransferase GlmU [Magnetococcales bacterium]